MRSVNVPSQRSIAVVSTLVILLLLAVIVSQQLQANDPEARETPSDTLDVAREQLDPLPTPIGAVVFDQPAAESPAWLASLFCPLPARVEMLAAETPSDADTEKLQQLRGSFEALLKEKAALLNAEALSAEIELQRRQVAELRALRELQKLQRSLQELSDKFPDSEAGKQALEVLDLLKQRAAQPGLNLLPTPDDGYRRQTRAPKFQSEESLRSVPRVHPAGDFPIPRGKPLKLEEQPIRPRAVPVPTEDINRPVP